MAIQRILRANWSQSRSYQRSPAAHPACRLAESLSSLRISTASHGRRPERLRLFCERPGFWEL